MKGIGILGDRFLKRICKSGNNLNTLDKCKPFRPKPPVTTLAPPATTAPPTSPVPVTTLPVTSEAPPTSPAPVTSEAPPSSPFVPQDLPPPEIPQERSTTSEVPPINPVTSEAPPSSPFVPQDLPPPEIPQERSTTSPSFEVTIQQPPTVVDPSLETNQNIAIGVGVSILGLILIGLLILYIRNIRNNE